MRRVFQENAQVANAGHCPAQEDGMSERQEPVRRMQQIVTKWSHSFGDSDNPPWPVEWADATDYDRDITGREAEHKSFRESHVEVVAEMTGVIKKLREALKSAAATLCGIADSHECPMPILVVAGFEKDRVNDALEEQA